MGHLVGLADKAGDQNTMHNDGKQYKPIRDAVAHTARITDEAKTKLKSVYDNIKGRVQLLLNNLGKP